MRARLRPDVVDMQRAASTAIGRAARRVLALAVAIAVVAARRSRSRSRCATTDARARASSRRRRRSRAVPIGPAAARATRCRSSPARRSSSGAGGTSRPPTPRRRWRPPRIRARPTALGDGAAFRRRPRNRWRALPPAPIAARYLATAVWTGSEMLVVGGLSDAVPVAVRPTTVSTGRAPRTTPRPTDGGAFPTLPSASSDIGRGREPSWSSRATARGRRSQLAAFDPARNSWSRLPAPTAAFQARRGGRNAVRLER